MKVKPQLRNPKGKGGFAEHPENRSNGHWDSRLTFSFQYRRFLQMPLDKYKRWITEVKDEDKTPIEVIAYTAVGKAKNSNEERKEIADRTEGKPLQKIEANVTNVSEELDKLELTDYEELGRQAKKQMVANEPPVQN